MRPNLIDLPDDPDVMHIEHRLRRREMARDLRRRQTRSETLLWQVVRNRGIDGLRFRRQQPIGPYVVDFLCFEHRLVVEIDGPIHEEQKEHDAAREYALQQRGYQVFRVSADDVEHDLPTVLARIRAAIATAPLSRVREKGRG